MAGGDRASRDLYAADLADAVAEFASELKKFARLLTGQTLRWIVRRIGFESCPCMDTEVLRTTRLWLMAGLLILSSTGHGAEKLRQTLTLVPDRPAAPNFELLDVEGNVHRLSDHRGKVVIVNFWATWCPPCREEMPSMQRAWEKTQDNGIVLLAVNVGESEDQVFTFTADYPVEFPLLLDQDSSVLKQWPVRGLPTTFVVDAAGRIVYRAIGGREWDDQGLLNQVRALRDESTSRIVAAPR